MTFQAAAAAAIAAIDAVFGEPVLYTGAGLPGPTEIVAIWTDGQAGAFQGDGATARQISCEIAKAALPERPRRTDTVTRAGVTRRVNQVEDRDDIVGRWVLTLERAS